MFLLGKTPISNKKKPTNSNKSKNTNTHDDFILFNNIGLIIKYISLFILILGSVACVVCAIYLMIKINFLFGLLTLLGIIGVYIISCFIYGFGELIVKTQEIADNTGTTEQKN